MPEPQVSFAIVARNAAGEVLADVQLDLEKVAARARSTGTGFQGLGEAAEGSGRGLRKMEMGIQALAAQVAGVEGPIGKILEGALAFGVGGAAVAGFAAGFVAMRAAMDFFTKDAREAREELEALLAVSDKLGESASRTALVNKLKAETAVKTAQQRFDEIEAIPANVRNKDEEAQRQRDLDNAKESLARFTAEREKILTGDETKIADAVTEFFQHVGDVMVAEAEKLKKKGDELVARNKTEAVNPFGMMRPEDIRHRASQDFLNAVGPRTPLTVSAGDMAHIEDVRQQTAAAKFKVKDSAEDFSGAATVAIASFGAMARAAITGSGQMADAVIGGITEIVQAAIAAKATDLGKLAGPLGAIVGVVGGIALGFMHHSKSNPMPVSIEEDHTNKDKAQNVYNFFGDPTQAQAYAADAGRASRADDIERLAKGNYPWGTVG